MIRKMIRVIEMIRRMVNTSLTSLKFKWLTHLNLKGFKDFQLLVKFKRAPKIFKILLAGPIKFQGFYRF